MNPLAYPTDLNAPGAIEQLLAYHRQLAGDLVMEDPPAGGQGGQGGGDGGGQGGDQGQAGNGGQGGTQTAERTFTQGDLDRVLTERLAAERKKHEQALEDEKAKLGKSAEEKASPQRTGLAGVTAD